MTGFTFSLIATFFFVLYTPNIVFKSFVKNKWMNLLVCSLFFIFSVYLVNFILNRGFIEGFKEGVNQSDASDRASNAFGRTNEHLSKLSTNKSSFNGTGTSNYPGLRDTIYHEQSKKYVADYGAYAKHLSLNESITMPPTLNKLMTNDKSDKAITERLDCFKNNIINGITFPKNSEIKNFTCSEKKSATTKPATTKPAIVAGAAGKVVEKKTTTTPPKKKK
jgi:hypothetical protein